MDTKRKASKFYMSSNKINFSFEPTAKCNSNCVHCPREKLVRKGTLPLSLFHMYVPQMEQMKPGNISFAGIGEPLLNKDLPLMVKSAASIATTFITTNAQLLTKHWVGDLLMAGISFAVVSVHTCRLELYEQLMVGCKFATMVENVRAAVRNGLQVKMQVVVSGATKGHLKETWEFAKSLGCSEVFWSLLHNRGGHLTASTRAMPPSNKCDVIDGTIFIDSLGIIRSCCHDLENITDYGRSVKDALPLRHTRPLNSMCDACNDSLRDLATIQSDLRANGVKQEWFGLIK